MAKETARRGPTATLHGQLYLLAFDRKRHRFEGDNLKLFGFALRAAMLTDLYLTGHLEDKQGQPYASRVERLGDPLLRAAFEQSVSSGKDWAELITESQGKPPTRARPD